MKLMTGTSRVALKIGPIVLKFPRFLFYVKDIWRYRRYKVKVRNSTIVFVNGFIANLTEFCISLCRKEEFLARTYFTLGFVNVQKYIDGEKPSRDDINNTFKTLSQAAWWDRDEIDGHVWDPSNFVKTDKGMVMVDYGYAFSGRLGSIAGFIAEHHEEMESLMLKKQSTAE